MTTRTNSISKPNRLIEFLAPLCLVAFFLYASSTVIGLTMDDDAYYLQASPLLHLNNFLHFKDWGALYLVWLRAVGIFYHNPIHTSFLSWGLLVALISLIPLTLRTPSAWIYTCIIVILPVLTIGPYVSLLAAAILLLGLCLVMRRERSLAWTAAAATAACFLLAFVRPEFTYGVYISAFATLPATLFDPNQKIPPQPSTRRPAAFAIFLAAVMLLLSLHAPRSRSGLAFAEHYAWRAAQLGLIPPGPNTWNSDYAARRFGLDAAHNPKTGTATLADFFHANPRLFFGHLWHNFQDPYCWAFILLILTACILPFRLRGQTLLRAPALYLLLLSVPPLLATVIIYPRTHYMIILFPALTIFLLQFASSANPAERPTKHPAQPNPLWLIPCFALIWLFNHNHIIGKSDQAIADRVSLRQVQCTYSLDSASTSTSRTVFSAVLLLPIYLPHPRDIVSPDTLPTLTAFQQWIAQAHPAWISVDPTLPARYGLTSQQMDTLLHDHLGYIPHPCPADAHLTVYQNDQVAR